MTLFNAYLMVDWSGASSPRSGKDSIWYALLIRRGNEIDLEAIENPATRARATEELGDRLAALAAAGQRVLLGFDFPFGYPAGTAQRLGLGGVPWRQVWQMLSDLIEDDERNCNNRFAVAETLNQRLSGEPFPFWGNTREELRRYLLRRGRRPHRKGDLAEWRLCERRAKSTQSVWKLAGAGSVGSQTLTGIPRVWQLRNDPRFAKLSAIWPFETGLSCDPTAQVVFAEIYPSLFERKRLPDKPKDAGQVVGTAECLAAADRAGRLSELFAGDPTLSADERASVEQEEAWILGVSAQPVSLFRTDRDYLRDPAEIYRVSRECARAETDLAGIAADLVEVALRLVHASGEPGIVADLAASPGAGDAGRAALRAGATVLVDTEMVVHGVIRAGLPADNAVLCTLNGPGVAERARAIGTTRSAAAVELWGDALAGAVVAIGTAPTALYRLIELLDAGAPKPALIVAMPVGFVGAAESKQALIESRLGVPYIAIRGRRGGSALAAAAVNALASEPGA